MRHVIEKLNEQKTYRLSLKDGHLSVSGSVWFLGLLVLIPALLMALAVLQP